MKTVVLIPCYNEEKTISKVVSDFKESLPHAEIYVYDNNSSDRTAELAAAAGAIVRKEPKQGKGNVVRSMFREIEADCYIMVDGDDTYPSAAAPEMERLVLEEKADMVVGDRLSSTYFTENKRPFHGIGNRLVRWLINHIFDAELKDIMTGIRAFSWEFVKSFPVTSRGFEIETEMTVFALDNNMNIREMPVDYKDRPEGSESKLNTYTDGIKVLRTIGRLFRDTKPLAFFSLISAFMLIICAALFVPILIEFLKTGEVLRFPTLIVLSGFGVVAILSFFCGLILSVLRKQHRDQTERYMNMLSIQKNDSRPRI